VSSLKFNKVIFIESLNSNELKTGKSLAEDLEYIKIENNLPIPIEYFDISNSSEFLYCLRELTEETKKNNIFPVLQIDAHGSDNPHGLVMRSGDLIEWLYLEDQLRKLNVASKGNLLLVTASCFGQFANMSVAIQNRAPFWAVVGAMEIIQVHDIQRTLRLFYSSLFAQSEPNEITKSFNNSLLKVVTTEWFFVQAYKFMVEKLQPSIPASKEEFENLINHFFMVDIHPENKDKISVSFEQLSLNNH
jgi:hypothetical protein